MTLAIVDAGPLIAAANSSDRAHESCIAVLQDRRSELVIPALVVVEVAYLLATRLGPAAEATFIEGLNQFDVRSPDGDWNRIGALIRQYADFPLGAVDATVIALAERLDAEVVMTLDQRHFRAVRPRHRESLALLP